MKKQTLCLFFRFLRGVGPSGPEAESHPVAAESLQNKQKKWTGAFAPTTT